MTDVPAGNRPGAGAPATASSAIASPAAQGEKSTALRCPTRRTGRGTAKLAALRAAAGEMFLSCGYDGVSLDEVVRVAGGSKTNIYGFFGGKEGLFLASVEQMCRDLQARLAARDIEALPLAEGLVALGRDLAGLLLEPAHLALYRLVIGETARFPALGPIWYANGPLATRARIAEFVVRHAATDGPAGPAALPGGLTPDEFARAFHDLAVTDILYRALIGAPPDADERARIVAAAVAVMLR